ncbi:MAG: sulfite exporter TauE/SafE family protein [Sporichthyaceae bacterium]|nr:sulfite exporter TauE/SafE family protein [Sporichthyaceae bacterium]
MTFWEAVAVALAGLGAGAINTVVGSGTLITFPVLLAVGYPPVLANVSNTVGLVPGSLSGVIGYRAELTGQARRLLRLGAASLLGGTTGAVLLLVLPERAFRAIVPALIILACALVVVQPKLSARLRRHDGEPPAAARPLLYAGIFATGIYGGYFGAAQGVLLIAVMGLLLDDDLQRVNAAKNVLALLVNGVAALVFITVTDVAWAAAGLIAGGSVVGAQLGALIGRRIPDGALRGVVVVVGVLAVVQILGD